MTQRVRCALCVGGALKRAFVACFTRFLFRRVHHVYTCVTQVAARTQRPCPSNTGRWFRQFLVVYHYLDKGRGGGMQA